MYFVDGVWSLSFSYMHKQFIKNSAWEKQILAEMERETGKIFYETASAIV